MTRFTDTDDEEQEHIVPNDCVLHIDAAGCWCYPTDKGGGVWVHHSTLGFEKEADDE